MSVLFDLSTYSEAFGLVAVVIVVLVVAPLADRVCPIERWADDDERLHPRTGRPF